MLPGAAPEWGYDILPQLLKMIDSQPLRISRKNAV